MLKGLVLVRIHIKLIFLEEATNTAKGRLEKFDRLFAEGNLGPLLNGAVGGNGSDVNIILETLREVRYHLFAVD